MFNLILGFSFTSGDQSLLSQLSSYLLSLMFLNCVVPNKKHQNSQKSQKKPSNNNLKSVGIYFRWDSFAYFMILYRKSNNYFIVPLINHHQCVITLS